MIKYNQIVQYWQTLTRLNEKGGAGWKHEEFYTDVNRNMELIVFDQVKYVYIMFHGDGNIVVSIDIKWH